MEVVVCSDIHGLRSIILMIMLFLILWSSTTVSSSSSTRINSTSKDRLALTAFKHGINRDPLGVLSSWNDSVHYCRWTGVYCSHKHVDRVTALSLRSYGLVGSLSPHIGNLTFLISIVLQNNSFHGQIPSELGRLFRLIALELSNNSFEGTFPINLTKCSDLSYLSLIDNKLQGKIPAQVGSLSKLQSLDLSKNYFTGSIPASQGNLSSLLQLGMWENSLEGSIPEDLGKLTNLTHLNIRNNKLTGTIPYSLYNLSALLGINLVSNQLSGTIHPDIGLAFPHLIHLSVLDNRFTGPIPVSLSNASNLVSIQFQVNHFTGPVPRDLGMLHNAQFISMGRNQLGGSTTGDDLSFIPSLVNSTRLQYLIFQDNSLQGSLPSTIANLSTQIIWIAFGENQIHGTIPSEIFTNLVNLEIFSMNSNRLTGNIPPNIGKLQKLWNLYLYANELSGRIPSSLGNLTLLSSLYFDDNNLFGEIPPNLAASQNLLYLSLSNNNLNGSIPTEFFGLSSSPVFLDFSNNALTSSLPLEVGNMINLVALNLSNNRLSGALPNTLAKCLMIQELRLDGNFFHEEIPTALQTLRSLEYLDLSRNNFFGHISAYLGNLPFLAYLNLSFNKLNGEVPKLGVFKNATMVSLEGNYNLCGGIQHLNLPICPTSSTKDKKKPLVIKVVIPVITATLCLSLLALILIVRHWRRKSRKNVSSTQLYNNQFKRISYVDLHKATRGFSESNIIGVGSYGSVYKGVLDQEEIAIAVKVFNLQRRGASKSFMSECKALKKIRHRNLVKILSACSSLDFQGNDFKALVYELMPQGSLEEWLHPKVGEDAHEKLNFQQRLNIAIDVASALQYLHSHCDGIIVHSDLKPSNVLLDDNMTAHVSDFGLAKIISTISSATSTHTNQSSSTIVKGSIGYVAPGMNCFHLKVLLQEF